ncbi:GntR family transcriptional regulator [Bacillus fonticola]|uniref:GntR family transcriptional regulator n=1 Tax=Bacillus fonticola TaxID=2728853 RepID=UPI001475AA0A|nr:GntR family transcriptional regulator [Bacillus fonticola]
MDAYKIIRKKILLGDFSQGQRLTEEYLCEQLSISRTPIREAIRRLESDGLIMSLKRGVAVRSFTKEDVRQIYDLRALLEGYAASQAAHNRSEKDINKLQATNHAFAEQLAVYDEENKETLESVVNENRAFHEALIASSKNAHVQMLISKVTVLPLVYGQFHWNSVVGMERSKAAHDTLISAIMKKDGERARSAMLEHIYQGRDAVLTHLTKDGKIIEGAEPI